jgi:hypothetical protein
MLTHAFFKLVLLLKALAPLFAHLSHLAHQAPIATAEEVVHVVQEVE